MRLTIGLPAVCVISGGRGTAAISCRSEGGATPNHPRPRHRPCAGGRIWPGHGAARRAGTLARTRPHRRFGVARGETDGLRVDRARADARGRPHETRRWIGFAGRCRKGDRTKNSVLPWRKRKDKGAPPPRNLSSRSACILNVRAIPAFLRSAALSRLRGRAKPPQRVKTRMSS